VINCFNGARFLPEALNSVIAQTYPNWEVIFWDNQSTDESKEIFLRYSDPRFCYFFADVHTGLGDARNLAVAKANGEWIAFLDCDDYWLPEKLEHQILALGKEGEAVGLVYGPATMFRQDMDGTKTVIGEIPLGHSGRVLPSGRIFLELLMENFVPLVSALIRKSAYLQCGGIPPGYRQAEDYALFLSIAKRWDAIASKRSLCCYRVHGGNISHQQKRLGLEESLRAVQEVATGLARQRSSRRHSTALALFQIWEGDWRQGIRVLLRHGSLWDALYFVRSLLKNRYSLLLND
jgi:glycosyltransferase involved in cell wall biosynthesis